MTLGKTLAWLSPWRLPCRTSRMKRRTRNGHGRGQSISGHQEAVAEGETREKGGAHALLRHAITVLR